MGSPIGFGWTFGRLNGRNIPWAKVVDFVPLEALSGPGAPDPDLARFHVTVKHEILNISIYVCNNTTFCTNVTWCDSLGKSTKTSEIPLS